MNSLDYHFGVNILQLQPFSDNEHVAEYVGLYSRAWRQGLKHELIVRIPNARVDNREFCWYLQWWGQRHYQPSLSGQFIPEAPPPPWPNLLSVSERRDSVRQLTCKRVVFATLL